MEKISVLHSAGRRLAKLWFSETEKPKGYDNARQFRVEEHPVSDIFELSALLSAIENNPEACVVRGKFVGMEVAQLMHQGLCDADAAQGKTSTLPSLGFTLRRAELFRDEPSRYCMFDVDSFDSRFDPVTDPESAIDDYIKAYLPECFHEVTYHWQLSGSAGHATAGGKLKAHIWFWLTDPIDCERMDAAFVGHDHVDRTVFRVVQVNYTAAPVIEEGVECPVIRRSGLRQGLLGDTATFDAQPSQVATSFAVEGGKKGRADMIDPREKPGVIGLFHRLYSIEQVVENWLSDVYAFVTPKRLNFLASESKSIESVGVSWHRQGLFNSSNSDPFNQRHANKFDLIRHWRFGHLDAAMDDFERAAVGPNARSQEAALRFIRELPEVKVALAEEEAAKRAADNAKRDAKVGEYKARIDSATGQNELREVAAAVSADEDLDDLDRGVLEGVFKKQLDSVVGTKTPIGTVRKMLAAKRVSFREVDELQAPDWARRWVYVTAEARFMHLDLKQKISKEAFDAAFGRYCEPDDNGYVPQASKLALDVWRIPVVYQTMYAPQLAEVFEADGHRYANEYRFDSPPKAADLNDYLTIRGMEILERHLRVVIPNDEYRETFKRWAAWIVRNPGRKVLWATVIIGIQGDGKSTIGKMFNAAMGDQNVGVVGSETIIGSNFNDWAAGRCLNIFEELKVPGHSRLDIGNRLKPLITNNRIEIHGKGKASVTGGNTCNYLAFSNHEDALPVELGDRRYFILKTPWVNDISELNNCILATGVSDVEAYWDVLHEVINHRPDIVRAYFESVDINGFNPTSRAPTTVYHKQALASSAHPDEGYVRDALALECLGVSEEVVSVKCLRGALKAVTGDNIPHFRISATLTSMGYAYCGHKTIKWMGEPHRFWVRKTALLACPDADVPRAAVELMDSEPGRRFIRDLADKTKTHEALF